VTTRNDRIARQKDREQDATQQLLTREGLARFLHSKN
jgi:hypothetical protein